MRYLTDVEKTERIKMQKIELRKMSLKQNRLVLKLREVSENKSVNVQEDLHEDLCTIVTDNIIVRWHSLPVIALSAYFGSSNPKPHV